MYASRINALGEATDRHCFVLGFFFYEEESERVLAVWEFDISNICMRIRGPEVVFNFQFSSRVTRLSFMSLKCLILICELKRTNVLEVSTTWSCGKVELLSVTHTSPRPRRVCVPRPPAFTPKFKKYIFPNLEKCIGEAVRISWQYVYNHLSFE